MTEYYQNNLIRQGQPPKNNKHCKFAKNGNLLTKEGFYLTNKFPKVLLHLKGLPKTHIMVLCAIASYGINEFNPALDTIGKDVKRSKTQVARIVNDLEKSNILKIERGTPHIDKSKRTSNSYSFNWRKIFEFSDDASNEVQKRYILIPILSNKYNKTIRPKFKFKKSKKNASHLDIKIPSKRKNKSFAKLVKDFGFELTFRAVGFYKKVLPWVNHVPNHLNKYRHLMTELIDNEKSRDERQKREDQESLEFKREMEEARNDKEMSKNIAEKLSENIKVIQSASITTFAKKPRQATKKPKNESMEDLLLKIGAI